MGRNNSGAIASVADDGIVSIWCNKPPEYWFFLHTLIINI